MRNFDLDKIRSCTGATMTVIGLGGLGGACEGQGSFLISAVVFGVGLGLSLLGLIGE